MRRMRAVVLVVSMASLLACGAKRGDVGGDAGRADAARADAGSGGGGALCTNTCASAGDGECDDGGERSLFSVCALGTDCMDCGPRGGGTCTPNCAGRTCGPNGCGGTCGPGCTGGSTCTAAGTCTTASSCTGVGEACVTSGDCCTNLTCRFDSNQCATCVGIGADCGSGDDCCSGVCRGGQCESR